MMHHLCLLTFHFLLLTYLKKTVFVRGREGGGGDVALVWG